MSQTAVALNPFINGGPVREAADFVGRETELFGVMDQIAKGGSVNVIGDRRVGKTSFLFHLMRPEVRERYLPPDGSLLFVFVDTQVCPMEPEGFFREVFSAASIAYPDLDIPVPDGDVSESDVRQLFQRLAPGRMVLLIDEFERITESDTFEPRFFLFLRGLCSAYALSLVVSTCHRLIETCALEVISSPFPNIFGHVQLGGWTPEEVQSLLEHASEESGAPLTTLYDRICSLGGHFPYLVQMAGWQYYRRLQENGELVPEDHESVEHAFVEEARPHLDALWDRHLRHAEQRTLIHVAVGGATPDEQCVWRLEQRGYLYQGDYVSESLRRYVLERHQRDISAAENAPEVPPQGVFVDVESGNAYVDGELIHPPLPKNQFSLLQLLYEERGRICSFYRIVEAVWSEDYMDQIDDQRIAQLISRLRRRVEPNGKPWRYIVTVRGRGLTLGDPNLND